jgi:hypothetical protein
MGGHCCHYGLTAWGSFAIGDRWGDHRHVLMHAHLMAIQRAVRCFKGTLQGAKAVLAWMATHC